MPPVEAVPKTSSEAPQPPKPEAHIRNRDRFLGALRGVAGKLVLDKDIGKTREAIPGIDQANYHLEEITDAAGNLVQKIETYPIQNENYQGERMLVIEGAGGLMPVERFIPEARYAATVIPGLRIVGINQPLIGGTTRPSNVDAPSIDSSWEAYGQYGIDAYAATMLNAAKALSGGKKYILQGESFGGRAALGAAVKAIDNPDQFALPEALILTAPATEPLSAAKFGLGMAMQPKDEDESAPQNQKLFRTLNPPIEKPDAQGEAAILKLGIGKPEIALSTLAAAQQFGLSRADAEKIANSGIKVLIIHGSRDTLVSQQSIATLTENLGQAATLKTYEGANHAVHGDRVKNVYEDISEFLGTNGILTPQQLGQTPAV